MAWAQPVQEGNQTCSSEMTSIVARKEISRVTVWT